MLKTRTLCCKPIGEIYYETDQLPMVRQIACSRNPDQEERCCVSNTGAVMISSAAVVTTNPAAIDAVAAAGADDVEVRLFEIFRKYLKVEDVRWDSATTMEEAQIDSLDLVEVIFEIE